MEEALEADNYIAATVSSGLELASALQAYITAFEGSGRDFRDIVPYINSTASALTQLRGVIDCDKAIDSHQSTRKVLKNEGHEHIMALVVRCRKVYTAIPVLITEAGHSESRRKTMLRTNHQEISTFEVSSISHSLKWSWLKRRIIRCQEQLEWLDTGLLFIFQLAALAQFQIGSPTRVHGTFDKELVLRHIVAGLRSAQLKLARTLEEKYRNSPEATSSQDTDISSDAETKSVLQIEVQRLGGENPRDIPVSDDSGKGVKIKSDFSPNHQSTSPTQYAPVIANSNPVAALSDRNSDCGTFVADSGKVIGDEREDVTAEIVRAEKSLTDNNKVDYFSVLDFQYKSSALSRFRALFRRVRKFIQDCKSKTLVAYSINYSTKTLSELPVGHHGLMEQLMKTVNRNKGSICDHLVSRDKELDWVIATAKKLDPRVQYCVALDFRNKQPSIAFFALGAPVRPVHLKDCVGRSHDIPFEHCKLEPLREIINELFLAFDDLKRHVNACHYNLLLVEGDTMSIITPTLWDATVKPGSSLSMEMWPPSRFSGPPPPGPGPGPGPVWPRSRPPFNPNEVTILPTRMRRGWPRYGFDSLQDKVKDLEIDAELRAMGVELNFATEVKLAEVSLGEVLNTFTNATDDLGELRFEISGYESDSDSLADGGD